MVPLLALLAALSFALAGARTASLAADVPAPAALLPGSLIVTYYGNPLSKRMGILGEIPPEPMMDRLQKEADLWQAAVGTSTVVRPALELVATVAADWPGQDKKYRTRMPNAVIEKVLGWARSRGWPTILDIQVGRSTTLEEIARLTPYLKQPDVHLALDPEFQMKRGQKPGERVGSSDAEDVNIAIIMLAELVERNNLPPKILLVHRFTKSMLKRYDRIRLDPRVQVVVVMDGFGAPVAKKKVFGMMVTSEPVQFAGVKLFYKNDKPLLTHEEVLGLEPTPRVIIYQ